MHAGSETGQSKNFCKRVYVERRADRKRWRFKDSDTARRPVRIQDVLRPCRTGFVVAEEEGPGESKSSFCRSDRNPIISICFIFLGECSR